MKYISLFSGIGGFELGILNSQYGDKLECIGYAEIDKYANSIYRRRFPEHKALGDVTKLKTSDLPDFELLVGGFPCQAFSIAGKRRGFDDTRGTLFFEIARILKDKRPRYFLLENVKGLLSHDKGETFKTILRVLSDLGYDVTWEVLNSKNFGVPQNRERIFIKGYFREECGREILFQTRGYKENPRRLNSYRDKKRSYSIYDNTETITRTLTSSGQNNGFNHLIKLDVIPDDFDKIDDYAYMTTTKNGDSFALTTVGNRQMSLKKKQDNYVLEKCISRTNAYKLRRLTPLECERLQGFPDFWTKYGVDGELISDTQRYKCIGNAVTTNVVQYIFDNWDLRL